MSAIRTLRHIALAGGFVLLVGLVFAYAQRDDSAPILAIVVLAAGTLMTVVPATVVAAWTEAGRGLSASVIVQRPLPQTTFGSAAAFVGLVDLLAAPLATGWFGVFGVALIAAALLSVARILGRADDAPDLATVRAAYALASFGVDHRGDGVRVAIERTGGWHRLVAVAPDGAYGDFVVRDGAQALAAADLAGATVVDQTDAAVFGTIRTSRYEWRRMAGSQL